MRIRAVRKRLGLAAAILAAAVALGSALAYHLAVTQAPAPAAGSPFVSGAAFGRRRALVTPQDRPARLALGSRATIVLAMATWCKFCA